MEFLKEKWTVLHKSRLSILVIVFLAIWVQMVAQDPVCVDNVNISLDNNCMVIPDAEMFLTNYNSSETYKLEFSSSNGKIIDSLFDGEDLGKSFRVMVSIEGTSDTSLCWSNFKVEDKSPPIVQCAGNDTVTCAEYQSFTDGKYSENCKVQEVTTLSENILTYQCDPNFASKIIRRWAVKDMSGNISNICNDTFFVERIDVTDLKLLSKDINLYCEDMSDKTNFNPTLKEGGIPTLGGVPYNEYNMASCNAFVTYEDKLISTKYCERVYHRVWKLTEWNCFAGEPKIITQIIRVRSRSLPKYTVGNRNLTYGVGGNKCYTLINLPRISQTKNCMGDSFNITVTFDGRTYPQQFANNIRLDKGSHVLQYHGDQACGNRVFDEIITINIIDNMTPITICRDTTIYLAQGGIKTLDVSAVDCGSFDYCDDTLKSLYIRRISNTCEIPADLVGNKPSITLCSADIGKDLMVVIFTADAAGNKDSCMAIVRVRQLSAAQSTYHLVGIVNNTKDEAIADLIVMSNDNQMSDEKTNQFGAFSIKTNIEGEELSFIGKKEWNAMKVNTRDVLTLQEMMLDPLNIDPLAKMIADINGDGEISVLDMELLTNKVIKNEDNGVLKYLLFNKSDLKATNFVKARKMKFKSGVHNSNMELVGMLCGDLQNQEVDPVIEYFSGNKSSNHYWFYDFVENEHNIEFAINTGESVQVKGFQTTIEYDAASIEFESVVDAGKLLSKKYFGLNEVDKGKILISWVPDNVQSWNTGETLFKLKFKKKNKNAMPALTFNTESKKDILTSEIYTAQGKVLPLKISKGQMAFNFVLNKIEPNPWQSSVDIKFDLKREGEVEFSFFDSNRTLLKTVKSKYDKGANILSLNSSDIATSGMVFYSIRCENVVLSGTMVKI